MSSIRRVTGSASAPVNLTAASGTITPNAATGSLFRHTATADVQLADPIGGADGQSVVVEILASGADRVLSFPGSTAALTIPSGQVWSGTLRYRAADTLWLLDDGTAGAAAVGATTGARTVYSFDPPPGLTPVVTGSASQTTTIQAHLDYVKAQWGGGCVVVTSPGGDVTCGGTAGLVIPAGVQLRSDGKTKLYFPNLTTGSAITVNDTDCTPLVGVWIDGPNWNPTVLAYPSGNASVGINVTGTGLRFYDIKVRYFGAGWFWANSHTYIAKVYGGSTGNCGVAIYDDGEGNTLTENGESIAYIGHTLHNSLLGIWATGNNLDLHLIGGSIDYCTEFGRISNAHVYLTSTHLETTGASSTSYLFDVRNNSHVYMSNLEIIMGGRAHIFNPAFGPVNYSYGKAQFQNVSVYFTDAAAAAYTRYDEDLISWESGATTKTIYTPFPLRWCAISVEFVATDGFGIPNDDRVRISALTTSTGQLTLTAPTFAGQRWVCVQY
jgi:hypothetical protein